MDPIKCPFSPGAGAPPPDLAGRDEILEQARILLGRVKQGRPEKSILLTGLRGVGKTVLLNEMECIARTDGYLSVLLEGHEDQPLAVLLAPYIRGLLYRLDRQAGTGDRVRRGLAVLKSFIGAAKVPAQGLEFGLDIDPEKGTADSGDLEIDLADVFEAVAQAAVEHGACAVIVIDELQHFKKKELNALSTAMQKIQQRQLPLVFLGAGLPVLPGLTGQSRPYAEQPFVFSDTGALSQPDACKALQGPVAQFQVKFEQNALEEIFHWTQGYPYFLQEWGYQAWKAAESSLIDVEVVHAVSERAARRLDENFYKPGFDRLSSAEKRFLRAMAYLGTGPQRTGKIAKLLSIKIHGLGPTRANLMHKGMIYSPSHGNLEFTAPLFDKFIRRSVPMFGGGGIRA